MKKLKIAIFFLFVTIVSNNGYGQSRVGVKLNEISNEFTEIEYPGRRIGKSYGGGYHIYLETEIGSIAYYANEDSICYQTLVIPKNDSIFNDLISDYNKDFKIINNKSWILENSKSTWAILIKVIDDSNDVLFKKRGKYFNYTVINK